MAQTTAYNKAQDYERILDINKRQEALGWTVQALIDPTGATSAELNLTAKTKDGEPVTGFQPIGVFEQFDGELRRIEIDFRVRAAGAYRAKIETPTSGRWIASIELRRGDDVYRLRETVVLLP